MPNVEGVSQISLGPVKEWDRPMDDIDDFWMDAQAAMERQKVKGVSTLATLKVFPGHLLHVYAAFSQAVEWLRVSHERVAVRDRPVTTGKVVDVLRKGHPATTPTLTRTHKVMRNCSCSHQALLSTARTSRALMAPTGLGSWRLRRLYSTGASHLSESTSLHHIHASQTSPRAPPTTHRYTTFPMPTTHHP